MMRRLVRRDEAGGPDRRAIDRGQRALPDRGSRRTAGALLIACALLAGCSEKPSGETAAEPAAHTSAGATSPTTEQPDALELLERAERMAARVDPVQWSVDARAETFGPDVEPIFLFVRDAIRYEPYAGALRGASGTYTARAGNAADRALLLAHLLERKGLATRFAIGTLTERHRERLWLHAFDAPATSARGLPLVGDGQTFHERLFRRAERDYDAVRKTLGDRLRPVTNPSRDDVLGEMNPHVWVQTEVEGTWLDLDPSLPDAIPGRTFATVEQVISELPGELFQHLTIRVMAEHLSNGKVVPSTLLEVSHSAIDLVDRQIALIHTQASGFNGIGFAIGNALGSPSDSWSPALWIAGAFTFGASVDVGAADFVAERIEFELAWPGGRKEISHRLLADRAAAGWRGAQPLDATGLHPLDRDDRGPLAMQAVHNIWLSAGRHNLADFTQAALVLAERQLLSAMTDGVNGSATGDAISAEFGDSIWPVALQNFTWMLWTDHVVIPMLNDTDGVRLFADGPRIAIFTDAPAANDRVVSISDLRRDDLRGLAADASKQRVLAERKLRYGLLQGALEQEALTELAMFESGQASGVDSTSQRIAGGPLTVLTASDATAESLGSQGSTLRLRSALAAGHTVVASANINERDSWWEIAAETGDTRSTSELGLHWGWLIKGRGPRIQGGKGGVSYTKEAAEEIARARDQAERKKKLAEILRKNAENPHRAMPQNNNLGPRQGGGGGMEYAVLVVVATIQAIAYTILTQMLIDKLYSETELLIEWLEAGGFRDLVEQP